MKAAMRKIFAFALAATMVFTIVPWFASAADNTGTFTAATMNVDGLPQKILFVELNGDGPGASGTTAISKKIAAAGWDLIGVSENFAYNKQLMSALSGYSSGTHRGSVTGLSNNTDGLNMIWKNSIAVTGEKWTSWNNEYSTGILGTGNGADSMIDKGYRYYQATVAEGVNVDVYILHMDAASDAGDIAAREKQLAQLVAAIKASDNGNPIIIMGDTNSRYTRENLQTILIDGINSDSRFTIQDAWVEKVWNGNYPAYGSLPLVASDKITAEDIAAGVQPRSYPEAEIVDKIFYINNTDSSVTLEALSYTIATNFTNDSGKALADHWPVVVEFQYTIGKCSHDYQVTAQTQPTCELLGSVSYACANCGDTHSELIPALGHDTRTVTVEPTCENGGSIQNTCARCGLSTAQLIPELGHDYAETVYPATCENGGHIASQCTRCDDSHIALIPALGHDTVVVTVDPTCTTMGSIQTTCTRCDLSTAELIPELGHDHKTIVTNATCTEGGYTTHICDCGDSFISAEVAPLGHDYSCEETKGCWVYTCANCGDSYSEKIPGSFTYTKVSSMSADNSYVITLTSGSKYYAVSHKDNSIQAVAVTVSNGEITSEITEDMVWTYQNNMLTYSEDDGFHYLYVSGGRLKIGTTGTLTTSSSSKVTFSSNRIKVSSYYLRYSSNAVSASLISSTTAYPFIQN